MAKYSSDISPRSFRFSSFSSENRQWHGSDIETYHFNALALFLPILEQLVVLSIKKSLHKIDCPKLKSEVASLLSQEAIHGREFHRYNQTLIYPHYKVRTQQYRLVFFRVLAGLINRYSSTFHYALSAAGEHFTAIAAEVFLCDERWFKQAPAKFSAIWRWHCIEEIEHQSVAFDVFQYFKGRYFFRVLAMFMMTLMFAVLYIKPIWQMMKEDKKRIDWSFYKRAIAYYWGKSGLCRALLKPYLRYYRPSFHPSQQQNGNLIKEWKQLFAVSSPEKAMMALEQTTP